MAVLFTFLTILCTPTGSILPTVQPSSNAAFQEARERKSTVHLKLSTFGDDPERCCGEGGGRGVHVWERM